MRRRRASRRDQEILSCIKQYQCEYGRSPTQREIGGLVGIHVSYVSMRLKAMAARGLVRLTRAGQGRKVDVHIIGRGSQHNDDAHPEPARQLRQVDAGDAGAELFHCDAFHCKLTRAACAARWSGDQRLVHRPSDTVAHRYCQRCPIGAAHARGERPVPQSQLSRGTGEHGRATQVR